MFIKNFLNLYFGINDDHTLVRGRNALNDEIVNELVFNSLKGKKYFDAVCLSNPTQIQPDKTAIGTNLYNPVKVRPIDIHGFILPDPCTEDLPPEQLQAVIQSHPLAFGVRPLNTNQRIPVFGDILQCYFLIDGPNNGGKLRGIRYEYSLKTHKFDYKCAERLKKVVSKFNQNPLMLLGTTAPEPPPPKPVVRHRNLQSIPLELDEELDEDASVDDFSENYHKEGVKEYNDWIRWNRDSGNVPLFKMLKVDSVRSLHMIFPRTDVFNFCRETNTSLKPDQVRYFNSDNPILLPNRKNDRFASIVRTGGRYDYENITPKYQRTMMLRILPFIKNYKWPYSVSEFDDHLKSYPELAAHWIAVADSHQNRKCVSHAKLFWNSRTDQSELTERAKNPTYPNGSGIRSEDWELYLIDKSYEPPAIRTYKAKPGDSVYKIARINSITRDNFKNWNNIGPDNFVGVNREYVIENPNDPKFFPSMNATGLVYMGSFDYKLMPCESSTVEFDEFQQPILEDR